MEFLRWPGGGGGSGTALRRRGLLRLRPLTGGRVRRGGLATDSPRLPAQCRPRPRVLPARAWLFGATWPSCGDLRTCWEASVPVLGPSHCAVGMLPWAPLCRVCSGLGRSRRRQVSGGSAATGGRPVRVPGGDSPPVGDTAPWQKPCEPSVPRRDDAWVGDPYEVPTDRVTSHDGSGSGRGLR